MSTPRDQKVHLKTLVPGPLWAEDDVADIPSADLRAGKDENKRYFLIGPRKDSKAPKEGAARQAPGGRGAGHGAWRPRQPRNERPRPASIRGC